MTARGNGRFRIAVTACREQHHAPCFIVQARTQSKKLSASSDFDRLLSLFQIRFG